MKALTYQGSRQVAYDTVPDPQILTDLDVIVKVCLTAICGSDLHVYNGRETGLDQGTVMGHEFIGTIVDCGRGVSNFQKGDKVFSPFFSACGGCFYCENDLSCRCENGHLFGWVEKGVGLHGAQSEYVRVPLADSTLYKIPGDITDEEALLLCDILPTGYFCADMARPKIGEVMAVVGCGPVGLLAITALLEKGVEKVFAVDMVNERLEHAQKFGAIPVNANSEVAIATILEATKGRGVDAVLEAVGSPSAQNLAYKLVRPGGVISVVGVHSEKNFSFTPMDLYNKNLTYSTGRCPVQHYVPALLPFVRSGKYDFTSIISHRVDLAEGVGAYAMFNE
ncbi:MAG: alcohol dehydrogenase family protein, partial [Cyclobacteriaceae bacterium]|nr:alcohol dehydrogenase family protein [Cyclobacteriaceae bacterium]